MAQQKETGPASMLGILNAERGVPQFDGTLSKWREHEKRAVIFIARMTVEKKANEAALMLASGLSGAAWDYMEDQLDITELTSDNAAQKFLASLKARFKMDDRAELADDFESYFYKLKRLKGDTLFDFIARFRAVERKLKTHDLQMPEKIRAWMLLRKSGYDANQKALVMSIVGVKENFTFDKVAGAMESTFGQESTVFEPNHPRRQYFGEDVEEEYFHDLDDADAQDDYEDTTRGGEPEEWPDAEEEHYQQAATSTPFQPDPEEQYDVEEYDEIYANYVGARKRFNDLRLSRGFYPVMAVVDNGSSSSQMPRTSPSPAASGRGRPPAKGKGKGDRRPAKGKSNAKGSTATAKARGKAASTPPSQNCLRCGEPGHWASSTSRWPTARPVSFL